MFNEKFIVLFPLIQSLNWFQTFLKCGLQALKTRHISAHIEKACTVRAFFFPPLCSVLSKLRFSLKCALECWSRFVYKGVVSLSRVHQRHRNKRHLRNSENQKMLMLLFSLIPPWVTSELSIKTQSQAHPSDKCTLSLCGNVLVDVFGERCCKPQTSLRFAPM